MDFNELYNRLWGFDGVHPFGDPFKFEEYMNSLSEDVETDTCEFIKGDFKTIFTCRFNKQGFLVGHSVVSSYIGEDNNLDEMLQKALEDEDYTLAAAIKRRIDASRS